MDYVSEFDTPGLVGAQAANNQFNHPACELMGSPSAFKAFGAYFYSDVASAANGAKVQVSHDNGATWQTVWQGTLAAGVPQSVETPILAKQMRCTLLNGAGAAVAAYVQQYRRRN